MSLVMAERGTSLAVRRSAADAAALTIDEIWYMAERAAASKMFGGIDNADKAFTLMCICQSEGIHPIQALKRYDIIQGRPAMKAAAIQAEFLARGGTIELLESSPTVARARFGHPTKQPTPFEMTARIEDYRHLASKDNWKYYAADMLWARLVSRACRRIDPGIVTGIGSVEEVQDTIEIEDYARRPQVAPSSHAGPMPPRGADIAVPGSPAGFDGRSLIEVIQCAADSVGKNLIDALQYLRNQAVQAGKITGEIPTRKQKIVESLTLLYGVERDWLRNEIAAFAEPAEAELPPQPSAVYTEDDPASYEGDVTVADDAEQPELWPAGRE